MQKLFFSASPPFHAQRIIHMLWVLALVCCCAGFSTAPGAAHAPAADGWVFHKTVSNVDFYYMLANCDGKKVVLLKFENKNSHNVKVSWKEVFTTQMEKGVEGLNGKKQLIIAPGETSSSGCKDDKIKELVILPIQVKPTYAAQILSFEFADIDVAAAF